MIMPLLNLIMALLKERWFFMININPEHRLKKSTIEFLMSFNNYTRIHSNN